jgi:hypothetical protein
MSQSLRTVLKQRTFIRVMAAATLLETALAVMGVFSANREGFDWVSLIFACILAMTFFVGSIVAKDEFGFWCRLLAIFIIGCIVGMLAAYFSASFVIEAVVAISIATVVMSGAVILVPSLFEGFSILIFPVLAFWSVGPFRYTIADAFGLEVQNSLLANLLYYGMVLVCLAAVTYDWARAIKKGDYTVHAALTASGGLMLSRRNSRKRFAFFRR